MNRTILFGPPGTGKTTSLLKHLEQHLKDGVNPARVAFLTFTRRARAEALERVEQVLGFAAKDLPYFRTIHSMAFRALGLSNGDVLDTRHLAAFGTAMGVRFGRQAASELAAEGIASQGEGDQLLALDNIARLRGDPLRKVWNAAGCGIDWTVVEHFSRSYTAYKTEAGLLDFTDVLTQFVREGKRLDVDVAFIDEAQDLSALQWLVALSACEGAAAQYVAGDDDQAIYKWAGADVGTFMTLPGERRVLGHSYRLPRAVLGVAQRLSTRIKQRIPKEFTPREAEGLVTRHTNAEALPLATTTGPWLWLVRNRYLLLPLRALLEQRGVVYTEHGYSSINESERDAIYTWERLRAGKAVDVVAARDVYQQFKSRTQIKHGHKLLPKAADDAQLTLEQLRAEHGLLAEGTWFEVFKGIPIERRMYYRKLLREYKTLKLPARVQLDTIHGAKGAECENVALFLEQSRRTYEEAQTNRDDEHRVFYVGATRAKEALHVVQPQAEFAYPWPGK